MEIIAYDLGNRHPKGASGSKTSRVDSQRQNRQISDVILSERSAPQKQPSSPHKKRGRANRKHLVHTICIIVMKRLIQTNARGH